MTFVHIADECRIVLIMSAKLSFCDWKSQGKSGKFATENL